MLLKPRRGWEQGLTRQGEAGMTFCFICDSWFVANLFMKIFKATKAALKILCANNQTLIN